MAETWVLNASPVIVLAKLDLLDAPDRTLVLPDRVAGEILAGPVDDPGRVALEGGALSMRPIVVVPPTGIKQGRRLEVAQEHEARVSLGGVRAIEVETDLDRCPLGRVVATEVDRKLSPTARAHLLQGQASVMSKESGSPPRRREWRSRHGARLQSRGPRLRSRT